MDSREHSDAMKARGFAASVFNSCPSFGIQSFKDACSIRLCMMEVFLKELLYNKGAWSFENCYIRSSVGWSTPISPKDAAREFSCCASSVETPFAFA